MAKTFDLLKGTSTLIPSLPDWYIENQLAIPLSVKEVTDVGELTTAVVFIFRALISLSKVFGVQANGKRSLAEDQQVIYDQLAASLSAVGVDGRGCLLRFICEAQNTKIRKLNLLGKMLATLLTPKEDHFLEEYNQAAALGKAGECRGNFDSCPISLFNIFKFARTSKTPSKDSKKTFKDSKTSSNDKSSSQSHIPHV